MNAMTLDPSAVGQATLGRPRLLGLGNLVRKDLAEWFHGKRPWLVLGVTTSVFVLTAANARITEWAAASGRYLNSPAAPFKILPATPLVPPKANGGSRNDRV